MRGDLIVASLAQRRVFPLASDRPWTPGGVGVPNTLPVAPFDRLPFRPQVFVGVRPCDSAVGRTHELRSTCAPQATGGGFRGPVGVPVGAPGAQGGLGLPVICVPDQLQQPVHCCGRRAATVWIAGDVSPVFTHCTACLAATSRDQKKLGEPSIVPAPPVTYHCPHGGDHRPSPRPVEHRKPGDVARGRLSVISSKP